MSGTFKKIKPYFSTILIICCCCKYKSPLNGSKVRDSTNDLLTVTINGKILEDDILEVFFAETIQEPYSVKNRCRVNVKGSPRTQEMVFKLPKRTYPFKLRIDLGTKGHETPIEIDEIRLSTGFKDTIFEMDEIKMAFRANQYLEIEPDSNKFTRKRVDGIYDPFLLSNDLTEIVVDLFSE